MDTREGTKNRSKRNPGIYAEMQYQKKDGKYSMKYLNGDKLGHYFEVSLSTLERWWRVDNDYVNPDVMVISGVTIPKEGLDKPFKTSEEKKQIKKPKAVLEVESQVLPTLESIAEILTRHKIAVKKVNKSYIVFDDETTLHRYKYDIRIYTNERVKALLENFGFIVTKNITPDKKRPFMTIAASKDQFNLVIEAFEKCMKRI